MFLGGAFLPGLLAGDASSRRPVKYCSGLGVSDRLRLGTAGPSSLCHSAWLPAVERYGKWRGLIPGMRKRKRAARNRNVIKRVAAAIIIDPGPNALGVDAM